eukprot:403367675
MSILQKSLPKRFFARQVRTINEIINGEQRSPNPFKLSQDLKDKFVEYEKKYSLKEQNTNFIEEVHDFEISLQDECENPKFNLLSANFNEPLQGYCTPEGSERYFNRATSTGKVHSDNFTHFKLKNEGEHLTLSKMAIGTQTEHNGNLGDFYQYMCTKEAIRSGGVNFIDTASHFRFQLSERVIGQVLRTLTNKYGFNRDELFISTKHGIISDDQLQNYPADLVIEELKGQQYNLNQEDIVQNIFCMHPRFLERQFQQSRERMEIQTIDLAMLHAPFEQQSLISTTKSVKQKMLLAFEFYENKVQKGELKYYGLLADESVKMSAQEAEVYAKETNKSITRLMHDIYDTHKMVEDAFGKDHHFKFIQSILNVEQQYMLHLQNQNYGEGELQQKLSLLDLCQELGMGVIGYGVNLVNMRISAKDGPYDKVARQYQIMKSINHPALISCALGMDQLKYVESNLECLSLPNADDETRDKYLKPEEFKTMVQNEIISAEYINNNYDQLKKMKKNFHKQLK